MKARPPKAAIRPSSAGGESRVERFGPPCFVCGLPIGVRVIGPGSLVVSYAAVSEGLAGHEARVRHVTCDPSERRASSPRGRFR